MENIELTASVYAGLGDTPIDYYPQKGLYTAISYAFTDLILLAGMLLLALLLVPAGAGQRPAGPGAQPARRPLKTALAKLAAFGASLLRCWRFCTASTWFTAARPSAWGRWAAPSKACPL